jgi:uncharacterized protein (DUF58 family)
MAKSPGLSREALKEVRRVQLRTKRAVDTLLAGAYRSAFKGQGMEFAEVRAYEPGDDVRSIDWNVTARSGMPYIKRFQEERELTVMLVVDVSASSFFGSQRRSKDALMAEIGALLAFSANDNNDRIGLILFSSEIELYLPPKRGVRHALRIIRELLAYQPRQRGTNIRNALAFLGRVQRRSCICFLISDFLSLGFQHTLRVAAKRFDMIAVRVRDPNEIKLPSLRLLKLRDLETDRELLVDTSDPTTQKYFSERIETRTIKQERIMKRLGVGFIDIRSDEDYAHTIQKFFHSRRRRRAR